MTLPNRTNYIKHRHSDNACSSKEELIKSSNSKTTKIDLLSKYVAILEANCKKRWDENNSKDAILSAAKTVVSLNPGIEFTTCR
jgi:hypothetical protein